TEKHRCHDRTDCRSAEHQDVKQRERHVTKGYDHKQVWSKIATGSPKLSLRLSRPEGAHLVPPQSIDEEKHCHKRAQKCHDLVSGKMGLASQFDRTVGQDPKSETGKRKAHCLKLGHRSFHAVLSLPDRVLSV